MPNYINLMQKSANLKPCLLKLYVLTNTKGLCNDFSFYDEESVNRLLDQSKFIRMIYDSKQEENPDGTIEIELQHQKELTFEPRHIQRGIKFLIAMGLEFPAEYFNLKVTCNDIRRLLLHYYQKFRLPAIQGTLDYVRYNGNPHELSIQLEQLDGETREEFSLLLKDMFSIHIFDFCEDLMNFQLIGPTLTFAKYFSIPAIEYCAGLAVGCLVHVTSPRELQLKMQTLGITEQFSEDDPKFKMVLQQVKDLKF